MSWLSSFLGSKPTPYSPQLQATAKQAGQVAASDQAQGQQLVNYETSGTLPPGLQAQVNLATNDALEGVKSRYASLGLSDSTMEAGSEGYTKLQALALSGQLEQQLAQTGVQIMSQATQNLQIEGNVYQNLAQDQMAQDAQTTSMINQFMSTVGMVASLGTTSLLKKPS